MKLEDVGFYTLSDKRAQRATSRTKLKRCELILSSKCNFKCPYCRGIKSDYDKDLSLDEATYYVNMWADHKLENVRFSGGEPTLWSGLEYLVAHAKTMGVKRVAISTNGSADFGLYRTLHRAGVDDFSVSLDACCTSTGKIMSGGEDSFIKVSENIRRLSEISYVTVGVVITDTNVGELGEIIKYAHDLGVSDIRIIPSAQYNQTLTGAVEVPDEITQERPILRYRIDNIRRGVPVRGLEETGPRRCFLALDDVCSAGGFHFPCIIYMREGGDPIGKLDFGFRKERLEWVRNHDCFNDPICRKNCLDVCSFYNTVYMKSRISQCLIPRASSHSFTPERWAAGSIRTLGLDHFRFETLKTTGDRIKRALVGVCPSEFISHRPKVDHHAVMVESDDHDDFWFHIRDNELFEMYCPIT